MEAVYNCERLEFYHEWIVVNNGYLVEKFSETSIVVIVVYCIAWLPWVT